VVAVVAVVVAGVVVAGVTGVFGSAGSPRPAAGGTDRTSTAVVTRRSLVSQTQVNATLGYAGSYSVAGKGGGTVTWLPAAGRVIGEGQVLYRTDNSVPVFLLYGRVPAWRALSEGMTGADVAQLNAGLVKLRYASRAALGSRSGWDFFSGETAYALEQLQSRLGLTVTGTLPLGQAVFEPSALRVSTVSGSLGSPASGSGTVRVTGLDVAGLGDRELAGLRARRIGFVFQQYFLAEHQTVLGNVADGLLYAGLSVAGRREKAVSALHLVGLGHKLNARPTQLSGGERQRVAIARAVAGQPAIVLADEPTGNLDQATGQSLLALLEELNELGTTIVVVTHDQAIAARMHRQIQMLDGRIVTDTIRAARAAAMPGSWPGQEADERLTGYPWAEPGGSP